MTDEDSVVAAIVAALTASADVIAAFGGRPVQILDAPPARSAAGRAVKGYPAVILAGHEIEPGEDCSPDRLRVEIDVWDQGESRSRCRAIGRACWLTLNRGLEVPGHTVNFIRPQRLRSIGDPDPGIDRSRLDVLLHVTAHAP
ncbi:MAG: DUF3168 domain-containing protein [Acidobacteria bacterium]|nr:DUF3168 domain-containing protein [Acidobacteriota bacterium]